MDVPTIDQLMNFFFLFGDAGRSLGSVAVVGAGVRYPFPSIQSHFFYIF